MSHNSSPNNVPGANKGEAVSVAAPGLVGAGGTIFIGKPVAFRQQFYSYRTSVGVLVRRDSGHDVPEGLLRLAAAHVIGFGVEQSK